jgi:AraC family transcriptional regulator
MLRQSEQAGDDETDVDLDRAATPRSLALIKRLRAGAVDLAFGRFEASEGGDVRFPTLTLATHQGAPVEMSWRAPGSDRTRTTVLARNHFMLGGAAVPVWKRWSKPRSIFAFAIDGSLVARIAEQVFDGSARFEIDTQVGIYDPAIHGIAALARSELDQNGTQGTLYLEHLASALILLLLRQVQGSRHQPSAVIRGLPPRQLRRVLDYIEAHLADDLGLVELAAVAGLSISHFSEAFRSATGYPPHRYVTTIRVERARALLAERELPLSDIAYLVGFSSQSHFTTQFGRQVGMSPGQYRRSLL